MKEDLNACFSLGIKVAEYVHGVRRKGDEKKHDAIFEALHEIANGELTLLGTPEEILAEMPKPPTGIKMNVDHPVFREWVRASRESERMAAQLILKITRQ